MENDNIKINKRKYIFSKLFLVILGLMICTLNARYGFILPHGIDTCVWDEGFALTSHLKEILNNNTIILRFLLILTGFILDCIFLFFLYLFITKIKTFRPILALTIFISIKIICQVIIYLTQSLFQLKSPEDNLWKYPGFPSLVTSYSKSNYYFFSGPIGFVLITALEFKKNKYIKLFVFSVFLLIIEGLILLSLRGNYILDILTSLLFSHYTYINSDEYSYILDNFYFKFILKTI